jgi:hypothetical protein
MLARNVTSSAGGWCADSLEVQCANPPPGLMYSRAGRLAGISPARTASPPGFRPMCAFVRPFSGNERNGYYATSTVSGLRNDGLP